MATTPTQGVVTAVVIAIATLLLTGVQRLALDGDVDTQTDEKLGDKDVDTQTDEQLGDGDIGGVSGSAEDHDKYGNESSKTAGKMNA